MPTTTVDVRDAETRLLELLSLVGAGTEVILVKDNTPVARLVPVGAPPTARVAGLHRGAIWTSDDFDEPLPEAFWTGAA
jgi:antitoxin (DNA-binding transcriptional repressor) of toxin-antitoxin stability system